MTALPDPDSDSDPTSPPDATSPHRRRRRYRGTHPRRYGERYKELDSAAYPDMQRHILDQGRTPAGTHVPIMVAEILDALRPAPGQCVADVTLGFGGHAQAFLERIAPDGILIGIDRDAGQLAFTRERLAAVSTHERLWIHHGHFAGLPKVLASRGRPAVDVIFADLGLSSMQIDDPARGFSYKHDGPLDMRMDTSRTPTAAELLATISRDDLSAALRDLADEPLHGRIATAIAQARDRRPLTRTRELVDVILSALGTSRESWRAARGEAGNGSRGGALEDGRGDVRDDGGCAIHPAARTFQAVRILVNEELQGLDQLLRVAPWCLRPGGRIGILSFHSGEDRRVKHAFREGFRTGVYSSIAEGPVRADSSERRANPRSTAAKFRWAIRATEAAADS